MEKFYIDVSKLNDKQYNDLCDAFTKHGFQWCSGHMLHYFHYYDHMVFYAGKRKRCAHEGDPTRVDKDLIVNYLLATILANALNDLTKVVLLLEKLTPVWTKA